VTLRDFWRWLWTGGEPDPIAFVCDFCIRGKHVHDVNSGRCISRACECEEAS